MTHICYIDSQVPGVPPPARLAERIPPHGDRVGIDADAGVGGTWTYDPRGRVITESKTITSAGTYTTSYAYDAMDRVVTMTYPSNEVITQTYNAAAQLAQVRSTTYGVNYASGMTYNANGSLAQMTYGNGVSTRYGYLGLSGNPWDVRPGRGLASYGLLWRIRTEASNGQPLQDLRYSYDNVGNVSAIHDLPRAINGTLNYTLTDTFDTCNTTLWTYTTTYQTVPYNDSGNNVVKNTGSGSNWNAEFYRKQYALANGGGIQVRFKVDNAQAKFILALENNDTTYRRFAIYGHDGHLNVQYNDGAGYREPTTLTPTLQANIWYTLTMVVDDTRGQTLEVYPQNDPTRRSAYNIFLVAAKSWRFHAWTWTNASQGSLYLDDYREFNSGATVSPDELMNFQYDALDRLTQASKATNDGYTEAYQYNAIGNITNTSRLGNYLYGDTLHKHAATSAGSNQYAYDKNGNMITRTERVSSTLTYTYTQQWDVENRLSVVTNTVTGLVSRFYYDGDGKRVKHSDGVTTTVYIGTLYEKNVTTGVTTTYYYAGSTRVAMRQGSVVSYLHADHLGSASLATTSGGAVHSQQRYYPYGAPRWSSGTLPTDYRFTGQRSEEATLGSLYDYGARFYSPVLARFLSADTIVPSPGNPQSLNRYAYTVNNPVKYIDPTGHYVFEEDPSDPWIYSDPKVRSKQYYTHPEYKQGEITDAQFVVAATSPIWVPLMAVFGAEEAGELWFIAHGGIKGLIALLTGAACGDTDCTNEVAAGVTGIRRSIAEKILQNVTTSANETLGENPGLVRTVLSRDEYARGQTRQWAAAQYGNAVERLVAGQVRASPLLSRLYQHVSRPGVSTPDFVGKGVFSGLNFDVTVNTARQIANHLGRWYGPGLVIATYNRPPGFTVFP